MEEIDFSEFYTLKITDEPTLKKTEYVKNEKELFTTIPGINKDEKCPHCHKKALEFWANDETSKVNHKVNWTSRTNEYHCENCGKFIYYSQKSKVFYRSPYYSLSSSFFGPKKEPQKKHEFNISIPNTWNGNTCLVCGHKELYYIDGDADGAPTGAYVIEVVLRCPSCGLFWFAEERGD